jgi:lysophospholipase L1-like esterase
VSGLRAALKNLTAALIGLTAVLIGLEVALAWIFPPPLHYVYPQPLHDPDPRLGWTMKPHQRTYTIDEPVATNALGFRSPEIPAEKAPSVLRILCLGDSQTFGNGVAQEKTYPARLEALLNSRRVGGRVEVVNAGVQGYDPVQEVDLLERAAPLLAPDVVTIAIYLNDVGDVLRPDKGEWLDARTGEFKRTGFKSLTPYRLIYLAKRSRLYTLLDWRLRLLQSGGAGNSMTSVLEGRTPAPYEEGWRIIEAALARARDLASKRRFRLIVFPVPAAEEFLKAYPGEQYRSRVLALASDLGVEHFDPTPRLLAEGGSFERNFITWDGHIGPSTHEAIARMLSEVVMTPPTAIPGRQPKERE